MKSYCITPGLGISISISKMFKFLCLCFLCARQEADRRAILATDRFCFSMPWQSPQVMSKQYIHRLVGAMHPQSACKIYQQEARKFYFCCAVQLYVGNGIIGMN